MIKGIDISKWQGTPNFEQVKKDAKFVFIKAVEGYGYRDPQLTRNQTELRRLGIPLGYYAFVRPDLNNSAATEAQYLLDQIGELKHGELLLLDFEVSYKDTVKWCKTWLDYIYNKTGVKSLIYLNKSLESSLDWSSVIDGGYGLWLADYTHDSESSIPKTQWSIMAVRQYTNRAIVSGISGNVDGNVFYGNVKALLSYGYNANPETPEDPVENPLDNADCVKIDENISSEIEKRYALKEVYGYDKEWTFDEFIRNAIALMTEREYYATFLHEMNSKLIGTDDGEVKTTEEEQTAMKEYIDTALSIINDGVTNDILTFSDEEIRKEFFSRLFDSIFSKFSTK